MSLRFVLIALALLACYASAQTQVTCTKSTACEPWDLVQGPFCSRGNNMNLRFGIEIAPENGYERYNQQNSEATYAACVVVDELSAANLTNAGKYVGTIIPNATANETSIRFTQSSTTSWLSVYGFGGNDNIAFPNKETSAGTIMIFSNDSTICPEGKLPFVSFVILQISLNKGRFSYTADNNQPTGVGFDSTCSSGKCVLDSDYACIGAYGKENCAQCLTPEEMAAANVQVWMSYGGTDSAGKDLLSYSRNPLNYRQYAGSSAYSQVADSVSEAASGEFRRRDPLSP